MDTQEVETLYPSDPARGATWVPVAKLMPRSGEPVLACYKNSRGEWRCICACWVSARTEESNAESDIGEYDEASDTYYDPEGWYELIDNWGEFRSIAVTEGTVTHWMPLPQFPEESKNG